MRLRRSNGTLAWDTGKLECGRVTPQGAVAPLALSTSLTQEGPTVPGQAVSGAAEALGETHVPHTAVCFTETHAHALCFACPGLVKRGRLDTPWRSGKQESLPERPGPP